jgi:hypothetical protein
MRPPSRHPVPPATPRDLRRFALTVGGAFALLGALLLLRTRAVGWAALAIGTVLAAAGVVAPRRLGPVQRGWMRVALAISRVTTPIFMGIVYFLVLTPTGLVMRLVGRRPLARPRDATTFWVDRPPGERGSDLGRQF